MTGKAEALLALLILCLCTSVCITPHGTAATAATAATARIRTPSPSRTCTNAYTGTSTGTHVLITEICPNPCGGGDECEYVALTNPLPYAVRLGGWRLCDLRSAVRLPEITLQPSQTVYLVKNASALDVPALKASLGSVTLNNDGDVISLLDEKGRLMDTVAYGAVPSNIHGWSGEPLKTQEGIVLRRKLGNDGWMDSDSWRDWFPVAFEHRNRTTFKVRTFSFFGCVTAFVSPDCSFEAVSSEVKKCSNVILLNMYEFESFPLAELLLEAMGRNVTVRVLLEGAPVGGLSDDALAVAAIIEGGGGEVRLARSRPKMFDHAKYAVLDGGVLVLSENWKGVSMPVRGDSGGNRGWGVIIHDENVSSYFKELFLEDFGFGEPFKGAVGVASGDVVSGGRRAEKGVMAEARGEDDGFRVRTVSGSFEVKTFVAPENVLCDDPILEMISSARRRVYVEMFSVQKELCGEPNPYVEALLAAARRGCDVKVLLDSRDYNLERDDDNDDVLAFLNGVAAAEGLRLEARLADLDALGFSKVHNKGVIADDSVLISSFNWNEGALDNREVGVVVTNAELAAYFAEVFLHDWNASGGGDEGGTERVKNGGDKTKTAAGTAAALLSAYLIFLVVRRLRYGW
ncbi:MAG: phospholipase D-like domain-containing protein [Candidatus Alkanophagales archaeon]